MKLSLPTAPSALVVPPALASAVPRISLLEPEVSPAGGSEADATLGQALVFAFATGDAGEMLERAVDQTPLAASPWHQDDFAGDVFLAELVAHCLPLVARGRTLPTTGSLLRRILSSPPADLATTSFRQAVFAELAGDPSLRARTEELLVAVVAFRGLLAKAGGVRLDVQERRLSILRAIREVVRVASSGFERATSGLLRIHDWALAVGEQPAYLRLVELLAYEEGTTELDVRIRLGIDGKIRDLAVVGRVVAPSSFQRSPLQRLATRLMLLLQGARFDAHEVLARLVDEVFEGVVPLLPSFFSLAAGLELYIGGLGFRDLARRAGLPVSLPIFDDDAGPALDGLWNPLLLSEGARVVPSRLAVSHRARVIVTGPNSGGKTRLLQAIALTQMLGQAGLFVPAESARLPWASGLFVSLIEHARADQSEGRLGTELLRIRRLFESVRPGSLVILDELCSGTNPDEGEEIFRLVVKLLAELAPTAFITTHFLKFAARLEAEQASQASGRLEFLQVELDAAESPTFQFVPGVATTSLAHRTAVRLGVTEEALRSAIRSRV